DRGCGCQRWIRDIVPLFRWARGSNPPRFPGRRSAGGEREEAGAPRAWHLDFAGPVCGIAALGQPTTAAAGGAQAGGTPPRAAAREVIAPPAISPPATSSPETAPLTSLAAEVARRRTFAIISHPDAGKTTLTEKLLLFGGAINLAGQVKAKRDRRSTRSDWMK